MDKWNGHRSKIEESGFQAAVPVWGTGLREKYNQFLGFYTKVDLNEEQELEIRITARSITPCMADLLRNLFAMPGAQARSISSAGSDLEW